MIRPLRELASLKVKLGAIVGVSVLVATIVATVGTDHGVDAWLVIPVAVLAAMLVTQLLAAGMTAPLRQMTAAAGRMARGDYDTRVDAAGQDEVADLARAFNTMSADLKDVDQQRRELIATVSHELRTPAAAIRALAENLADGVTSPTPEHLDAVLAQSERLSDLLGDLLALSRVDAGQASLDLHDVPVADLLDAAVAEATALGRPLRFETGVRPPDLVVTADPSRLRQVLTNVLDNAARHSPPGGVVRLDARADGESWSLEVTDQGPGIDPADRDRVFERFGTDAAGGTGLGLAIARWICHLHHGRIQAVDPEPGRSGARLRLVLPQDPSRPGPAPSSPEPPRSAPAPSGIPVPPTKSPLTQGDPMKPTGTVIPPRPLDAAQRPTPPPALDRVFGMLWPERDLPGRPRLLAAALAVGVLAAIVLPFRNGGIGTTIVLLAAGASIVLASPRRGPLTVGCAALGLGLALLPTLRAAGWLIPLTLLAGGIVVLVAVTPARSLNALVGEAIAWPLAGLRGLPWLGRTLRLSGTRRSFWRGIRTVVISVVAGGIFLALFASADALLGRWVDAALPDLSIDTGVFRTFVFAAVFGVTLAGIYLALNPIPDESLTLPSAKPVSSRWEWLAPVGVVIGAYLAFLIAQATAWLAGHDYIQRTTGLTYADYVHQGFGQLSVASVLTLAVVGLANRKAGQREPRERLVLRIVLGVLCLLTLVVVASALWRMQLYQQAYGFTVLRLVVDVFELWVGLVVVLVMIAGVSRRRGWLVRAAALTGAGLVLTLGLMNPDAWVANRNIDRYAGGSAHRLDADYLSSLSEDATATIVARLSGPARVDALRDAGSLRQDDPLEWNLGRARARSALAGVEVRD